MQGVSRGIIAWSVLSLTVLLLLCSACVADPAGDFDRAKQLIADKNYAGAIQALNTVVAADATRAPAAKWLIGACYRELKDYPAAVSALDGALAICGANEKLEAGVRRQLGLCFMATKEWAKGVPMFEYVLAKQPDTPGCWHSIGTCYRNLKQYPQAIDALKKVVSNPSFRKDALAQLASCYFDSKDWTNALAAFGTLLSEYPDNGVTWQYRIGTCCRELRRYPEAIDALKKAIDDSRFRKDVLAQLAACSFDSKDWANALTAFQTLVSECPDGAAMWRYRIGRCCWELGKFAEAITAYEQAVASDALDASVVTDAKRSLIRCYEKVGDYDKARAMLQALLTERPDNAGIKLSLALASLKTNDYEHAKTYFADILNNNPNDPLAKCAAVNIAGCMCKQGNSVGALAFLDQLHTNRPDMGQDVLLAKAEILFTYAKRKNDALDLIRSLESNQLAATLSRDVRRVKAMMLLTDSSQSSACAGILDGLIREAPDDPKAEEWKFYRTLCFVNNKDWAGGRAAFSQFCKDYPKSDYCAQAKYYEGDCCVQLHITEAARSAFAEVVAKFPNSGWAQAASGRLTALNARQQSPNANNSGAEVSQ